MLHSAMVCREPSVNYQIEWCDQGVVVECSGLAVVQELDQVGSELYQDERFAGCHYQIFDLSKAELSKISLAQIRNTAELDYLASLKYPSPNLAIVSQNASAEALLFHYKLAAEVLGIKWRIGLFHSREEALSWALKL